MKNTIIDEKIRNNNCWYTDCQLQQASNNSTSRTILKRWNFILYALDKFIIKKHTNGNNAYKILDAGCGDGLNLQLLNNIPDIEIYGIDYNPLRIERVKERFPRVKVIEADLRNLQVHEKFDVVICSQVLEHIKEDDKVLKNFYNLLKYEGILILGIPNEGCFLGWLRDNIMQHKIKKETDHINFYNEKIIKEKIKKAGFQIKFKMQENFFFPFSKINASLSSSDVGFRFMNILGSIFKSQAAGYYFVSVKSLD